MGSGGCQLLWGNEMTGASNKGLVLAAMVFAVAMTFIDQTIVAIAVAQPPEGPVAVSRPGSPVGRSTATCSSLSALFAFGGRLADVLGSPADGDDRRRSGSPASSALLRLHPDGEHRPRPGSSPSGWSRVSSAALMFPAALAIVVASFPLEERGRAMALFFGITGGLTAIGPIAGGYLTQWTWRSIFWINVPVAIIALVLI